MEPRSYSRYILTVLCVAVVFTSLILVAINAWTTSRNLEKGLQSTENNVVNSTTDDLENAYKDGYNAARASLKAAGLYTGSADPNSFTGVVVSVGKDRVVVKQNNLDSNPQVDGISDDRIVLISSDTAINSQSQKSEEAFANEIANFNGANTEPPSPTTKKPISLSEIKPGAVIRVVSNAQVQYLLEIPAVEVSLFQAKE